MGVKGIQKGDGTDPTTGEAAVSSETEAVIDHAAADLTETDEGLSTISSFASSVRIGGGEVQLTSLTLDAKRESGLTSAQWNELTPAERSAHIQKTVDRMTAEAETASTEARKAAITEPAADVRVHMDRGIGGSYVAIGGGERIRVASASTDTGEPIKDDEELKSA